MALLRPYASSNGCHKPSRTPTGGGRSDRVRLRLSNPPDFRLERSELRSDDQFAEFGYEDLECYVDFRRTFDKLPVG
ncbi:MAG: hypothetical protein ACRDG9_06135 [Actinomycetota bacterium]